MRDSRGRPGEDTVRIGAVVLAAGHGTRMRSALPKVLHTVAGRPILEWVLRSLASTRLDDVVIVVGPEGDAVRRLAPPSARLAVQHERLGTGHAVSVGLDALDPSCDTVLVLSGDTPLITADLVAELVADHQIGGAGSMVTAILDSPESYGRVVRSATGAVERIVEARDATPAELAIAEVNAGLYCTRRAELEQALGRIGSGNDQNERYLTDAVTDLGGTLRAVVSPDSEVILGVNTRLDLAVCETIVQGRLRRALMLSGVTMPDPSLVYLDAEVEVAPDTILWPGTHLRGTTSIGTGCEIGPDAVIADTKVGEGSRILSANIRESEIGVGCEVGPFAYLRPGVRLDDGAKIGTFVEAKNSTLGRGAKVPHLSYVGDAEVGDGANIGAGNITANYDGFRKHRTVIGAGVKTGSDCVFVAPVRVGSFAMTGAGSIITHDIPDGALGIARARQSVIEGFTEKAEAKARAAANDASAGKPAG